MLLKGKLSVYGRRHHAHDIIQPQNFNICIRIDEIFCGQNYGNRQADDDPIGRPVTFTATESGTELNTYNT